MFEQELQVLLQKYPEIEDVSFTCKKIIRRDSAPIYQSGYTVPQGITSTASHNQYPVSAASLSDEAARMASETAIKLNKIKDLV